MTTKDLETLCANLSKASAEQLRELDDGQVIQLPPLDGVSKSEAVFEIIETLRGVSPPSVRLQYIAYLYMWLSVNKVLSSWTVYSVNPSKVPHIYFNVHRLIARAVGGRDRSLLFVTSVSPAARYACIMTPDKVPGTTQHAVICVCAWNGLSYVAICAIGAVNKRRLHSKVTSALRGKGEDLRIGTYPDLASSYVEARARHDLKNRRLVDF